MRNRIEPEYVREKIYIVCVCSPKLGQTMANRLNRARSIRIYIRNRGRRIIDVLALCENYTMRIHCLLFRF